ncbi:MAG: response regulator transcription factor [Rubrobacter sp.]|nr:response regulator transcription factor [Rubrobacter sp.]
MREPTRVLLADNHTMFREGLAGLLASYRGMEVVGNTTNDAEAAALAEETKPDVVIMQVQIPFERARETLTRMRAVSPPPKVVIVTMFEEPRYIRELMDLGASAYLLKSSSSEQLIGAVRAAVFDPEGENVIVGMPLEALERAGEEPESTLSARELEILLLMSRGLTNRQIATRLYLAEATVKRHLANVYEKMGVHSRGEATRKALTDEWITIRDVTEDAERDGYARNE